jgi:ATP-binding cassette subfamily B protein
MNTKSHNLNVVRYYWGHVRAYRRLLLGSILSIPITTLVNNYLPPLIVAGVINRLSKHDYDSVWHSFGPTLILYGALMLGGILAWRVVDYFMWRLEIHIQQDIAEEVFEHMMKESADFHANNFTGSLVSRTNKLMGGYIRAADTTIFQVYPMFIGFFLTAIILAPRAPLFVLALLIFVAIYLATAFWISRPVKRLSAKAAAAESKQTGALADAITNIMAIKSFARGSYERRRFHEATTLTRKLGFNFARVHQTQMNYLGALSRSISALSLTMAVISVVVFKVNLATAFLILSYTSTIVDQLFQFSNNSLRNYNRTFGDAKEMVQTLAETPSVLDPVAPEPPRISDGAVIFKNVSFTHNGADDAIFENFNLNIRPGEKIGLVGHSGSGKTTFTRLLLRFSDIDGGQILIDGQNIAHITQDDLHRHIAYVPQEPLLFHRSIAENIAYGKDEVDEATIKKTAELAHAAEFIDNLPKGYETLVGERGVKLSGGQRQRVAIARAMIKDAPILVLDEATSALDSESEKLIQSALWKLMQGRTTVVIAHRLSTIQKMDRIVVLDNGKIVEQGSHHELLKKNGTYAALWAHQSGGFLED